MPRLQLWYLQIIIGARWLPFQYDNIIPRLRRIKRVSKISLKREMWFKNELCFLLSEQTKDKVAKDCICQWANGNFMLMKQRDVVVNLDIKIGKYQENSQNSRNIKNFKPRTALKHVYYLGWNRSPAQVGCMRQVLRAGSLGRPRGIGWRGR